MEENGLKPLLKTLTNTDNSLDLETKMLTLITITIT